MIRHKIISISGPDGVGKQTQSRLLAHALQPSALMSFPDYDHWAGRIIRAMLHQEGEVTIASWGKPDTYYMAFPLRRDPHTFQMLQAICRLDKVDTILSGLETHHWIMDRYALDGEVYGYLDGCQPLWLREMLRLYPSEDLVIALIGESYRRVAEGDVLERNVELQRNICQRLKLHAQNDPKRITLVHTEAYRSSLRHRSMQMIHARLCGIVEERLGIPVTPLSRERILELCFRGDEEAGPVDPGAIPLPGEALPCLTR